MKIGWNDSHLSLSVESKRLLIARIMSHKQTILSLLRTITLPHNMKSAADAERLEKASFAYFFHAGFELGSLRPQYTNCPST